VLWPEAGITKLELARYYEAIAPRFLAQAGKSADRLGAMPKWPRGANASFSVRRSQRPPSR
jgi:DNA primase